MDDSDLPMPTERLYFGVSQSSDARLADMIWGDALVTNLTGGPFTRQEVEQRLAQEVKSWRQYGVQYWPLFQHRERVLTGCCGLRPRDMGSSIAELGFQLCSNAWGRGFAPEAAKAVIEWARAHSFAALIAGHHPANHASKRTL